MSKYSPINLAGEGPRLKVWWIPQVPMEAFEVELSSFVAAKVLLKSLAMYDLFQYEQKVKPDFCNMGGLCIWVESPDPDENGEQWTEWETGDGDCFNTVSLAECYALDENAKARQA